MEINKIFKALAASFTSVILYAMLVLPWKIWVDSVEFLSSQFDDKFIIKRYSKSEMKVISWLALFFSSLIFWSYPIGIGLLISIFFKGWEFDEIRFKFIFLTVLFYFLPIVLSFFKEIISLTWLKYFKLEAIEENTKSKE